MLNPFRGRSQGGRLRLSVSDPSAVPSLLAALREVDCVADRASLTSVDVRVPWLVDGLDAKQAVVELAFFARAWEAANLGVVVILV